jgi:hypothetical protein
MPAAHARFTEPGEAEAAEGAIAEYCCCFPL